MPDYIPDILGSTPPTDLTRDGARVDVGGRFFIRAILIDPTHRCTVEACLPIRTHRWVTGEPCSLWQVRLPDGRLAITEPSLMLVRPIQPALSTLAAEFRRRRRAGPDA